jgi:hypothetical protein
MESILLALFLIAVAGNVLQWRGKKTLVDDNEKLKDEVKYQTQLTKEANETIGNNRLHIKKATEQINNLNRINLFYYVLLNRINKEWYKVIKYVEDDLEAKQPNSLSLKLNKDTSEYTVNAPFFGSDIQDNLQLYVKVGDAHSNKQITKSLTNLLNEVYTLKDSSLVENGGMIETTYKLSDELIELRSLNKR